MHLKVDFANLRAEILRDIRTTHTLKFCPLCGNKLSSVTCHRGTWTQVPLDSQEWEENVHSKTCDACEIVWKLWLRHIGSDNEGNPSYWEGHQLYLTGYSRCFCRVEVFPETLIHKAKWGYSRILLGAGEECRVQES